MKKDPLVSIVMPNYNGEKFIADSIESVLNQTYKNWELIIVDDCSKDTSWKIISKYVKKDKRIKAIQNKKNLKIYKTRLAGIDKAKGEYYSVLDSDDIFKITKLKKQVDFLEKNPGYGVVGCDNIIINEKSDKIGTRIYPHTSKEILKTCIKKNPFANSATLSRMNLIKKFKYDLSLSNSADYDLWLNILKVSKGANLKEPLLKYRVYSGQEKSNVKKTLKNTIKIQKRYLFEKKFFSISGLIWFGMEHLVLILPNKVILKLFKRREYR